MDPPTTTRTCSTRKEVTTSDAAAVRWWIEPTAGVWPELHEALRIDGIEFAATGESPRQVRARWSVTVKIIDIALLRRRAHGPDGADDSFPELWNRVADPFAPLDGRPGITWEAVSVETVRGR